MALTAGTQVEATGSAQTRLMDMWDERPARLDLASSGSRPFLLTAGAKNTVALDIVNVAAEYAMLGAEDNASLRVPDANEWSVVIACRPVETAASLLTAYELGASATAADFPMMIRYIPQNGFSQCPQLMNANMTVNRIYDFSSEYANRDHVLAIGFDTANGLTMSDNGYIKAKNSTTTNNGLTPLTDTRFQFFGASAGVASINFNGLFYGALIYRKNIFKPAYSDYHAAAVSAYASKLGVAHAFA